MSFNQWAAVAKVPDGSRLAFEAVWNVMVGGGCSSNEASSLLTDLMQSLPEPEGHADWEDD
jgi:hypothetical protein